MKSEGTEIKIKSLQKALQVLECFVEKQPLGVTEISEKMGLYKSNVHNILSTFKAMDYLEQDPDSGKFRLGTAVFTLSRALRENLDISRIAVPFMRRIAEEAGEVVYLSIPRGEEVVYLEAVYPEAQKLSGSIVTGERARMHCTSVGKAILAGMSRAERDELLKEPLEAFTENTITDRGELEKELKLTAERQYGLDDMELMFGIKCVGVALCNHEGKPEGGLSISAPSLRMSEEKIRVFAEILNRYKLEIQKRL
ncbi:MAG TPA: IclR family transcriptional regulator [Lachnospiraceae bacterium]|nr:IclR family transcriptional regulator [Lachnospiraceae bacterium]